MFPTVALSRVFGPGFSFRDYVFSMKTKTGRRGKILKTRQQFSFPCFTSTSSWRETGSLHSLSVSTPARMAAKASKELEDQDFYHGFRPRKDVANLLHEPGDFLVRATDSRNNHAEIVISVFSEKKERLNLTLKFDNGMWQLGIFNRPDRKKKVAPRFPTVVELIEHYKKNKLPGHAYLRKVIPRPTWLIKHAQVTFDKTKDLLGSGNFCHVYKGLYERNAENKVVVAVKICHEGKASDKAVDESKEARNQMVQEAHLMSYYIHDYVIQMFGVACDHPPVLIVMEYCPGGDLMSHLQKQGSKIETPERLIYCMESARGMRYLHSQTCVHRDLAARNCLISARGMIKIADFGLSKMVKDLDQKEEDTKDEEAGTGKTQIPLRWMAVESISRPVKYSTKSDVWSFAVLLFEIFNNGEKPWPDWPPKKIATYIRNCNMMTLPEKTPQGVKDLCAAIWVKEPEKRPDMKKCCSLLHDLNKKHIPSDWNPAKMTINTIPGVNRLTGPVEETNDDDDTTNKNSTEKDVVPKSVLQTAQPDPGEKSVRQK